MPDLLPPGPSKKAFSGDLPGNAIVYSQLSKWATQFGEIYAVKLANKTAVVLSSAFAIDNILDKRAAMTANRPLNTMTHVTTAGMDIVSARTDATWHDLRKTTESIFSPATVDELAALHIAEATQLAADIADDQTKISQHLDRYSFSIVASTMFGNRIPSADSRVVTGFENYYENRPEGNELIRSSYLDHVPILRSLPHSLMSWGVNKPCKVQQEYYYKILQTLDSGHGGVGDKNSVFQVLGRAKEWGLQVDEVAPFRGALFEAGADMTGFFLRNMIALLIANPQVQQKAHEEMDEFVGSNRSPTLEDIEVLPYLRAIIKEVFRLRPLKPFAVPHATTGDVSFKNYVIPSGTTVFANVSGVLRDPEVFEAPNSFSPERYLNSECGVRPGLVESEYKVLNEANFGFGLRKCPGQRLATRAIDLAAAKLIWTFDFSALDGVPVGHGDSEHTIWHLNCRSTPRTATHAKIVGRDFAEASATLTAFELHCTRVEAFLPAASGSRQ